MGVGEVPTGKARSTSTVRERTLGQTGKGQAQHTHSCRAEQSAPDTCLPPHSQQSGQRPHQTSIPWKSKSKFEGGRGRVDVDGDVDGEGGVHRNRCGKERPGTDGDTHTHLTTHHTPHRGRLHWGRTRRFWDWDLGGRGGGRNDERDAMYVSM